MGLPERCDVGLLWTDMFLRYDFGPGHPFTETSRKMAVDLLDSAGAFDSGTIARAAPDRPATRAELGVFHEKGYLDLVARVSTDPTPNLLDAGDTPGFPGCFEAAGWIVEGATKALAGIRSGAWKHAFHPAGGLHHASPRRASGFCIFNDVAVVIATALRSGGSSDRVAYVDVDAHHGDGVMYGFYDEGRVLDIDFHQDGRTLFPGTGSVSETGARDGKGLKVNFPLPPGAGDDWVAPLFDRVAVPLIRDFRPQLIVLQSGVDGHSGDQLAGLHYSDDVYLRVASRLHALAHELSDGRFLVTGGGGYSPSNVSRLFARLPYAISGGDVPTYRRETLASQWVAEFRKQFGTEPSAFPEATPGPRPAGIPPGAERLRRRLESELGRRFPRNDPER